MINALQDEIYRSDTFTELFEQLRCLSPDAPLALIGVAGSLLAFVVAKVFDKRQAQVLLIASDEDKAEKLRDDCALLMGEASVRLFGARPMHQTSAEGGLDMTSTIAQVETLKALSSGMKCVVIASPHSIVEMVPPPRQFAQTVIELRANAEHNFQSLIDHLTELGFIRKEFVESYGDIAVRGGIVDVFPYVGENPLRLEFWGDTVESIREFDVLSQRSIRELESASIIPSLIKESTGSDEHDQNGEREHHVRTASLLDYLQNDAIVILDEPAMIKREIDELAMVTTSTPFTYDETYRRGAQFLMIISSSFGTGTSKIKNVNSSTNFNSLSQPAFNGSINVLVETLRKLSGEEYKIYLTCDTKDGAIRLRELIEDVITSPEEVGDSKSKIVEEEKTRVGEPQSETSSHIPSAIRYEIISESVHLGFMFQPARLAVFTEHQIFGRLKRRGMLKRRRFKGFSQKELQQLKRGDYVVHIDHGIGTFTGLSKIKVGGVEQEVMKLVFLEN
ncbi:MAG: hypothetical protein HY277_05760, partial [Ignavibacteriales bacterium]|nr:hypothetical protein [Ignavibacteriales bacterium]